MKVLYSIRDFFIQLITFAVYSLWQVLPINTASGIGAFIITILSSKYHRTTAATRKMLGRLNPEYTESDLDRIIRAMWDNIGRVWAESLITHRLARHRLTISGEEKLDAVTRLQCPVIVPFLHTGSWELITHVLVSRGIVCNSIIEVQQRPLFDFMLNHARRQNRLHLIKPDFHGRRQIMQCLSRGEFLGMGLDEYKDGKVLCPRFGRTINTPNNLDFCLRLARKYEAVLLPMLVMREPGVRFTLTIFDAIPVTRETDDTALEKIKSDLDSWAENHVRRHIEQWYMVQRFRFG